MNVLERPPTPAERLIWSSMDRQAAISRQKRELYARLE